MFEGFKAAPKREQTTDQPSPITEPTVGQEQEREQEIDQSSPITESTIGQEPERGPDQADRGREKEGYDPEKFSVAFSGLCALAAAAAELGKTLLEKRFGPAAVAAEAVGAGVLAETKELLKNPQVLSRMLSTAGKAYQTVEQVEQLADNFAFSRFEKKRLEEIESAPDEETKGSLKEKLSRHRSERSQRLEEDGLKRDIRDQVIGAAFTTLFPSKKEK